jgi:hexokinase
MVPQPKTLKTVLDDLESELELSTDDLNVILKQFRNRMDYGLAHEGQNMAMIPSFGRSMRGMHCDRNIAHSCVFVPHYAALWQ